MKLKHIIIASSGVFVLIFSLLLFVVVLFSDEEDGGGFHIQYGGVNVSAEVDVYKRQILLVTWDSLKSGVCQQSAES